MGIVDDINTKVVPRAQELIEKGMSMNYAIVQAFIELGYTERKDKNESI